MSLSIPKKSLFEYEGKKYCFIEEKPRVFKAIEVRLDDKTESEELEVLSGLNEGDRVVTEGVFSLKSIYLKSTFGDE